MGDGLQLGRLDHPVSLMAADEESVEVVQVDAEHVSLASRSMASMSGEMESEVDVSEDEDARQSLSESSLSVQDEDRESGSEGAFHQSVLETAGSVSRASAGTVSVMLSGAGAGAASTVVAPGLRSMLRTASDRRADGGVTDGLQLGRLDHPVSLMAADEESVEVVQVDAEHVSLASR